MKALIPYAVLGVIGAGGTLAGSLALPHHAPTGSASAPPLAALQPMAPQAQASAGGSVIVHAALERTVLPAQGTETFVRVALEGRRPAIKNTTRVPVSLTLLLDRSGSMSGQKLEDAKRAALEAIDSLLPGDTVAVVLFDSSAEAFGSATVAEGSSAVAALKERLRGVGPAGGTNMMEGLLYARTEAARILKPGAINRLLLLSDGQPDSEGGLREQVAELAKAGVSTTTLGLGADYNEDLMAALADAGLGHYYFIDDPTRLAGIFAEELKSLATIVANEARVEIEPADGVQVLDVIGFDERIDGGRAVVPAGDIYGGRTTDMLVRVRVAPHTAPTDLVRVRVSYSSLEKKARVEEQRVLAATFTTDAQQSLASLVPEVAVKAEKWRTSESYARANEAYNRGDFAGGDVILREQQARLVSQSATLGSKDLADEAREVEVFQKQNAAAGEAGRGVTSKLAKRKAWSLNKGSGY